MIKNIKVFEIAYILAKTESSGTMYHIFYKDYVNMVARSRERASHARDFIKESLRLMRLHRLAFPNILK